MLAIYCAMAGLSVAEHLKNLLPCGGMADRANARAATSIRERRGEMKEGLHGARMLWVEAQRKRKHSMLPIIECWWTVVAGDGLARRPRYIYIYI